MTGTRTRFSATPLPSVGKLDVRLSTQCHNRHGKRTGKIYPCSMRLVDMSKFLELCCKRKRNKNKNKKIKNIENKAQIKVTNPVTLPLPPFTGNFSMTLMDQKYILTRRRCVSPTFKNKYIFKLRDFGKNYIETQFKMGINSKAVPTPRLDEGRGKNTFTLTATHKCTIRKNKDVLEVLRGMPHPLSFRPVAMPYSGN